LPTVTESSLVESSNVDCAVGDGGAGAVWAPTASPAYSAHDSALQDTMVTHAFVLNAAPLVKQTSLLWF